MAKDMWKEPPTPKEPKKVTGLWLAEARQEAIERAEACPVMLSSDGKTEYEAFPGAKKGQAYYVKMANEYARRLEKLVEPCTGKKKRA